ncbi:hypothetical protein [Trabulsiella odontotermitis]|uniref:hypothetical protein n=1 Tax=Trabulsiella odontotermitis TaxID=379893 RepID=UPI0012D7255E|nr:hypothetical protein [Trabulsiella odontotermitis]
MVKDIGMLTPGDPDSNPCNLIYLPDVKVEEKKASGEIARQLVNPLLAHLLYHAYALSAQHAVFLSDVRTLRTGGRFTGLPGDRLCRHARIISTLLSFTLNMTENLLLWFAN